MKNEIDETIYRVSLDRDNLDKLMNVLSDNNQIDTLIDPNGIMSFNIPKESNINIETINIFSYIEKDLSDLESSRSKGMATDEEYELRRSFLIGMTGYFEEKLDEKFKEKNEPEDEEVHGD